MSEHSPRRGAGAAARLRSLSRLLFLPHPRRRCDRKSSEYPNEHACRHTTCGAGPAAIQLSIDGRQVRVPAGTTVAAALVPAGWMSTRHSVRGEPRAPLCGMGICYECRVTIDGRPQCLACRTRCVAGMQVETT